MTVAVKSKSPQRDSSPENATVVDWLAANGIDEFIPGSPTFMVIDDRIVYRAYQFRGDRRGYDLDLLEEAYLRLLEEDRIVPLVAPLTDGVRAAFEVLENRQPSDQQCFLLEVVKGSTDARKAEAYRRRLGLDERLSRLQLRSDDGPAHTWLSLTAREGAVHIKVGDGYIADDDALSGAFILDEHRIGSLIEGLPKLREWLKSERPRSK